MKHVAGALMVMSALGSAPAGRAHAQSPAPPAAPAAGTSSALAEQLFNEARELAKAEKWAEACPKFEASLRYDPVLGTRLNLATCYERIGRLASAWGLYRESIELARKAGDTRRVDYAQRQAAALEPRLPRLTISVPASPPAGFEVKRGDVAVEPGAFGVGLYVDPGAHSVTASAPGFETFTTSVTLVEGKAETLAIPALVARPEAAPADDGKPAEPVDGEPAPRSRTRSYAALGVGAAGVVAVGVGLVFGNQARSSDREARALCGDDLTCPAADFDRGKQLVSDARSSATISTIAVIGGAAALAAGAILYITAPRARETTARIVPVTHDGGAGLAVVGAF